MGVKYTITYGSQSKEITDANNNSFVLSYGSRSESIAAGSGKTLSCAVKKMNADVSVGAHTLACSGKIMQNNVVVASQSYTPNVTITVTTNGDDNPRSFIDIPGHGSISTPQTITVPKGTTVTFRANSGSLSWLGLSENYIMVNGTKVVSNKYNNISYSLAINQNTSVYLYTGTTQSQITITY